MGGRKSMLGGGSTLGAAGGASLGSCRRREGKARKGQVKELLWRGVAKAIPCAHVPTPLDYSAHSYCQGTAGLTTPGTGSLLQSKHRHLY